MKYELLKDKLAIILGFKKINFSKNIAFPHWINSNGDAILDYESNHCHPIGNNIDDLILFLADGWSFTLQYNGHTLMYCIQSNYNGHKSEFYESIDPYEIMLKTVIHTHEVEKICQQISS